MSNLATVPRAGNISSDTRAGYAVRPGVSVCSAVDRRHETPMSTHAWRVGRAILGRAAISGAGSLAERRQQGRSRWARPSVADGAVVKADDGHELADR